MEGGENKWYAILAQESRHNTCFPQNPPTTGKQSAAGFEPSFLDFVI